MPEYRVYVIGEDGHISLRLDLVCANDDAAKERAKELADDRVLELWQFDREIETFKPDPIKNEQVARWLKGELRPPK
ncbi:MULTISPECIES: hypothetical protein [Bradyrhizobium]|jgi:hypothetical protein|uniref:hypothetical protein n=1 Tax=Bradyrhizobium TaxID=374 RepID=UPI00209F9801|nr:hypothetical protein [Bradyrhizobium japonicum]MCP1768440.1 hypothetical protein [Bradyrhizobium japonicum]MCP1794601.1 hypothetical protein [Bradyrhizobium japonicum]MCP1811133.1 hypothetical protein [Bradyrhizobium japonicum]MCP1821014.1 hypothetical protein [Bradyrhizobium japonicum]MCP1876050.1 hypothetical protein [Bradyrhizobium japonicum]